VSLAVWLKDVISGAGVAVIEEAGWKTRAAEGSTGPWGGIVCHHTVEDNPPVLDMILTLGNGSTPAPLANIYLRKDGVAHLCAAGRANHAGPGYWQGVTDGNGRMIGIEAQNHGDFVDPWPAAQLEAYARICAAIMNYLNKPTINVCGHKEWRGSIQLPKIDPTLDMSVFRSYVDGYRAYLMPHPSQPSQPSNLALSPPPPAPIITVGSVALNLRATANPGGKFLATMSPGATLTWLADGSYNGTPWVKGTMLQAPGLTGWCNKNYVTVA
jgi:hypothetical protein